MITAAKARELSDTRRTPAAVATIEKIASRIQEAAFRNKQFVIVDELSDADLELLTINGYTLWQCKMYMKHQWLILWQSECDDNG
jgi:hypothetical protein